MAETREGTERRWSMRIFRIAGIDVRVHVSFLLLVALFVLAGSAPEGPGVPSALAWLVALFACVLLHELAHCFVGRRHGLVVHEIDLLPIGGVSRLESMPETPADELAVAIAGPIASLLLGVLAALLAVATSQRLYPVDLINGSFLVRLAWVNVLLALFNLLPAFPLDGGRVFRALLERRHDLADATRIAGRVGRWFAWALIALGLVFDVWLTVIGVFVWFGATAEERATLIHLRLVNHRVRDVMLPHPVTLDARLLATDVRLLAGSDRQRVFPVVHDGRYAGTVTAASVARAPGDAHVGDLLARTTTLAPDDDLEAHLEALAAAPGAALAVLDAERVVGLLRMEEVDELALGDDHRGVR